MPYEDHVGLWLNRRRVMAVPAAMNLRAMYQALGGEADSLLAAAQTEAGEAVVNEQIEIAKMERAAAQHRDDMMRQMGLH